MAVRRFLPMLLVALAAAVLAWKAISGVLAKVGHPAAAIDDAYIHFQYARAIAEGHPFRYQAGEPVSTGATSFLWPALLAPFHAVGFRGQAILWPAWGLSFAALGALAWEAAALTRPLAGKAAAAGAAAMTLAFGGYAWCAASGMEVLPFAWAITTTARRAAEWFESPGARTKRAFYMLCALGLAAPLLRPEGAVVSLAACVTVALAPRGVKHGRLEALALVPLALAPQLLLLVLTGRVTSSTAQVKLLFGNPYFDFWDSFLGNVRILVGSILDGQTWSAEFLPEGGSFLALAGLGALAWRGHVSGRRVRAALVLLLALSMFIPCTYVTFLWNRLRYLWPFSVGWFIGLACLSRAVGDLVGLVDRRVGTALVGIMAGVCAGALLGRVPWVLEDVAQSASGIDRQQSELGRWANMHLPTGARIGVNDTGAIAYFGNRKTFDVVGLTTPSEGAYWVAGAASRFEHYERMHASTPELLPTHFIVYPEWMACPPVLGKELHEAVVTDASILGGQVMKVAEARWNLLGSGERPWTRVGIIEDEVDVADLESERAHAYVLEDARDGEEAVEEGNAPDGTIVVDGARTNRKHETFGVKLPADGALTGIVRLAAATPTAVHVTVAGHEVASFALGAEAWSEHAFDIPAELRGPSQKVEMRADGPFSSFHAWFGRP